ncbi:RTA1 like protein-domain-containing protein [Gilbertella persicaria]|uniref:RTA1 like protein-domain-containing protein n=1 Tax=Gilbertella persicaria TaxID=101096 RepID=UPI002220C42B|nr:RTA1 like protein-domain-containing protein [Gilbertella persicaria]KAI8075780.1 RTA1 like protein-domain-containing protein [Gilbertella persicaria]
MADTTSSAIPHEISTYDLFHYIPNLPLAVVGTVVFGLFFLYLTARVYMTKSPRFLYILPGTAICECIGYAVRVQCHSKTTIPTYAVMTLFLLLPPNALALVNYKCAGEIIRLSNVEAKFFFLKPKFVTWFFFSSDVFAFLMQSTGGGMQSTGDPSLSSTGSAITLIGLAVQLLFFACFAFIAFYLHHSHKYNYHIDGQVSPKKHLSYCLYITIVLLYIRSIYRIAEYATGYGGSIARLEWAFYVFDSLIILLCFISYSVLYIGNYLPKRGSEEHNATRKRARTLCCTI